MSAPPRSRTALVTGASSGIGEQFARDLAERGYALVLVARRADRLDALAAELADRFGTAAEVLSADLGAPDGTAAVEERLRADGPDGPAPVDLLVNNAGRGDGGAFAEQDPDDVEHMLDVNVRAVLRLARAVLPVQIARRERGERDPMGIINVSSMAGEMTVNPGGSVYGATKKFVTLWSESVALEAAPHGVHVTAVLPGFVRTDMTRAVQESGTPDAAFVPKERITRDALRAWAAGRTSVVPGAQYKLADGLLRAIPRTLYKAVAGRRTVL
ncbi:SDR family NAD(P)-dependent oxidoreductase [Nocardiopsis suaedae]|uniref:SDR family oxidoreductase n=1 Tax=Nocardiopsis suaedae TaxID=3018444 RepID=A0ABT4TM79_9ACTN|nr:SDR family oxidoreductase [Nocardiopsis suaedae]MDA2805793.1 SDR family oxidoreductase [Nocardiopsis suaedae]